MWPWARSGSVSTSFLWRTCANGEMKRDLNVWIHMSLWWEKYKKARVWHRTCLTFRPPLPLLFFLRFPPFLNFSSIFSLKNLWEPKQGQSTICRNVQHDFKHATPFRRLTLHNSTLNMTDWNDPIVSTLRVFLTRTTNHFPSTDLAFRPSPLADAGQMFRCSSSISLGLCWNDSGWDYPKCRFWLVDLNWKESSKMAPDFLLWNQSECLCGGQAPLK